MIKEGADKKAKTRWQITLQNLASLKGGLEVAKTV
jgi:hypothetical protein